jgi:type IV secretion system protein VirB5
MKRIFLICLMTGLTAGSAHAQGIPVYDQTAIAKQIESLAQLSAQLQTLKDQLDQARQLHQSLNRLTDMADLEPVLNALSQRKLITDAVSQVEVLTKGIGSGPLAALRDQKRGDSSTYRTDAQDFYARELSRIQNRNATDATLATQVLQTASGRVEGIDRLRQQIGKAETAKEVADLQARLQAEMAFLSNDLLQSQGLAMLQQSNARLDRQRQAEEWRRRLDAMRAALP